MATIMTTDIPSPERPPASTKLRAYEPLKSKTAKIGPPPKGSQYLILNHPPRAHILFRTQLSVVYTSDDRPGQVCKVPVPLPSSMEAHAVERRIYERLGPLQLPNLVPVLDMDDYGIWMSRAKYGCLRALDKDGGGAATINRETRLQWCEDVARVLASVHAQGVRHADLSGRNLLVDEDMRILLCDFSGSAIDNTKSTIRTESGYRHPDPEECTFPTIRGEVHALGSTMYEIVTAHEVHDGVPKEEVDKRIAAGEYPDVTDVPLGDIIQRCWTGKLSSAMEVADAVALARCDSA